MTQEVRLEEIRERAPLVRHLVEALNQGGLVAVPDDCGVAVLGSVLSERAVERLSKLSRIQDMPAVDAVAISHSSALMDYVQQPSGLLEKLLFRCLPGPIVLRISEGRHPLSDRWPPAARSWGTSPDGRAFYCPAQDFFATVLENMDAPALVRIAPPGTETLASLAKTEVDWIVHGEPRFRDLPTVARVKEEALIIEQEGVVSATLMSRLSGTVYLFLCTGNTCRSPMAEGLFRKMLADRLKCREDELLDRGYSVISAGLAAHGGSPASEHAVELLRHEGIDLATHASQQVTEELLYHADHILTMTRQHRDAVLGAYPELADKVRLLSQSNRDVSDPIGGGPEEYARCRDEIRGHLRTLIELIEPSV